MAFLKNDKLAQDMPQLAFKYYIFWDSFCLK